MPDTSALGEFTAALHYGPGPHPDGSPQSVHAGGANPATRPPRATEGQMGFDLEMRDVAKLPPDPVARRLRPATTPKARPAQEPEDGNGPKWQKWLSEMLEYDTDPTGARQVRQILQDSLPKATLKDLHDAYTITDPESGRASHISSIGYSKVEGKIFIFGEIYAKDATAPSGEAEVGNFRRSIAATGTVRHEVLLLQEDQQGQGFGARFYRNSERVYQRMGVTEIRLEANDAVGGYAWARMGFDFDPREERADRMRDDMVSKAELAWMGWQDAENDRRRMPKVSHAWEIAALTTPDGNRIGKSVMLGSSWPAVKYLTPGSPSLRVGNAYYRAKEKQRQEDKRVGDLVRAEKERRRAN